VVGAYRASIETPRAVAGSGRVFDLRPRRESGRRAGGDRLLIGVGRIAPLSP
jgi:hypothetical protein